MVAVSFNVNGEIFIAVWVGETVVLPQALNFLLGNRRNLALVRIECGQSYSRPAIAAAGAEILDEVFRRWPLGTLPDFVAVKTKTLGELEPKLGMVRRPSLLVDEV